MPKRIQVHPLVAIAAVILGGVAWIIIAGLIVIESQTATPTPMYSPHTNTAVAVIVVTATPIPHTETPTASTPTVPAIETSVPEIASTLPPLIIIPPSTRPPANATIVPTVSTVPAAGPTYVIVTSAAATVGVIANTPLPVANGCPPPTGWTTYRIKDGDTLFGFQLGADGKVDVQTIMEANCLKSKILMIGQVIYLPPGVAEKSPKIDDPGAPADGGTKRAGKCPCKITVRVGIRREQIADAIDREPLSFTGAQFLAATAAGAPTGNRWFLSGKPPSASLEGFMYAGTYTLQNETTAAGFRDILLDAFGANIAAQMGSDVNTNGVNFWQAIVLASIIERESQSPDVQKGIASIFYNRRRKGMPLGSYTTLQYALGRPGSWWPRLTASNVKTITPYDTLQSTALPPSPIATPGISAIMAAVYPAQTDYLFYNDKCDGSGAFFARTWEEFQKGIACGK